MLDLQGLAFAINNTHTRQGGERCQDFAQRSSAALLALLSLSVLLLLPSAAYCAGRHYRRRQGHVGRRASRRNRRSREPGADRESPVCRQRRHGPVPDRRSAPGHLLGDVHVAGFQHRQARRHRAVGHVRGHGQRATCGSARSRKRSPSPARRRSWTSRAPGRSRRSARTSSPRFPRRVTRRHSGPDSRHEYRTTDSGGITGTLTGRRRHHPRRARQRFADLCGRHQHGLGRRQRWWREHAAGVELAGSGDDHLGRPRRSGDQRGRSSTSFRARAPTRSAASSPSAARTARCRAATTPQELRTPACGRPSELLQRVRRQPDGRRPDRPRQAVVLHDLPSDRVGADGAGHVVATGTPATRMPGRSISTRAGRHSTTPLERQGDRASDLAGDAAQQVQYPLVRAVQRRELQTGGGTRDADDRSARTGRYYHPSRQPHATWSSPISGRLLMEAGWGMYQARYRMPTPRTTAPTTP